jgi:hypothetical protein
MDPMNPIVFLDIDGVLNTGKEYHEWNSAHDEALKEKKEGYNDRWLSPAGDPFAELLFGREHVDALNQITEDVDAKVVLSSSWRMFYASRFSDMVDLLKRVGVKAECLGPTPTHIPRRYSAVWAWLHANRKGQTVRFVCLDDEDPGFRDREILPHTALIDGSKGLLPKDYERVMKRLNRGKKIS